MNRFGAGPAGGGDDFIDTQIAFTGRGRSDEHCFVGHRHMLRVAIRFGEDRYRTNAHTPRGADDTASDLATIGD